MKINGSDYLTIDDLEDWSGEMSNNNNQGWICQKCESVY